MKKKLGLLLLMLVLAFNLTGCTKYIKDSDNNIVRNELTEQNMVENILCKPVNEVTIKQYQSIKEDFGKLPKCKDFVPTSGGYEGIWTSVFVKPLAWLILKIGYIVKNFGVAIILTTLLIRLIMMPFTKKAAEQSEAMKKIKPDMDKLEKKYRGKQDQQSQVQKSQEMMSIYKKYGINPMTGCLFSFIQLPLFLAFYEALYRLPVIFEGKFGPFDLGVSPWFAITNGKIYHIILVILVFGVTYYSFNISTTSVMNKDQEKTMNLTRNIMLVTIGITSFTVSAAISIYWIINSGFTILQNVYVKRRKEK